jgi:hypothetical protein
MADPPGFGPAGTGADWCCSTLWNAIPNISTSTMACQHPNSSLRTQRDSHAAAPTMSTGGARQSDARPAPSRLRRRIEVLGFAHGGKEANALNLVETGVAGNVDQVLSIYRPDCWIASQQALAQMPPSRILVETSRSSGEIARWKAARDRPRGDQCSPVVSAWARYSRETTWRIHAPSAPNGSIPTIRPRAQALVHRWFLRMRGRSRTTRAVSGPTSPELLGSSEHNPALPCLAGPSIAVGATLLHAIPYTAYGVPQVSSGRTIRSRTAPPEPQRTRVAALHACFSTF